MKVRYPYGPCPGSEIRIGPGRPESRSRVALAAGLLALGLWAAPGARADAPLFWVHEAGVLRVDASVAWAANASVQIEDAGRADLASGVAADWAWSLDGRAARSDHIRTFAIPGQSGTVVLSGVITLEVGAGGYYVIGSDYGPLRLSGTVSSISDGETPRVLVLRGGL
jgi:hypothetical protein